MCPPVVRALFKIPFLASWILGALLWGADPSPATTQSKVFECLPEFYKLAEPAQDTSVELEMENTPPVLSLFTTSSGLVGELFASSKITREVREWFPGKTELEIRTTPWAELSPAKKMKLLSIASFDKDTSFFEDRRIPRIQFVEELELQLYQIHEFMNQKFSPGVHSIRPRDYLKGPIEYMGPENDPRGVELHFRLAKPAGEVSRAASDFQELLGVERTHQHVYVVTPIPKEALQAQPKVIGPLNADFFRRVNLAAEMITVMEEGRPIRERKAMVNGEEVQFFGWLGAEQLNEVADYLVAQGNGRSYRMQDRVKIAWVGFRGHDKFDQPGLMGMEVRSVRPGGAERAYERFLNAIQKSWAEQNLGIGSGDFEQWLTSQYRGDYHQALTENWYHKKWDELVGKAPLSLKVAMLRMDSDLKSHLSKNAPEELKMVLHDWSHDPLFFNQPDRIHQIRNEQIQALTALKEGISEQTVIREFLEKSGLYESVLRSLAPQDQTNKE